MKNKNIISIICIVASALFFGCGSSGSSPVDDPAGDTSGKTSVTVSSGTDEVVAGSSEEEVAGSSEEDPCPNGTLTFKLRYLEGYNGAGLFVSNLIEGEDTVYVYCHPSSTSSGVGDLIELLDITYETIESGRRAYMGKEGFITFGTVVCENEVCGWSTDETKVKTVSLSNDCIEMEY